MNTYGAIKWEIDKKIPPNVTGGNAGVKHSMGLAGNLLAEHLSIQQME